MRILAVSQDSENAVGFYAAFYLLVRALSKKAETVLLMRRGWTMEYGRLPNEHRHNLEGSAKSLKYFRILLSLFVKYHFKFDVILVNGDFAAFQVLLLAKLFRIKCCIFLMGIYLDNGPYGKGTRLESFWFRPLSLGTYRYYDALITQTELYTKHVRRFVHTKHPITIVGQIIAAPSEHSPKEKGLLVAMGVVEDMKRPGSFIEVVRGVRERMGPHVHGVWIGSGTQLKKYSDMAAREGSFIQFAGNVGEDDKWKYLSKAEVFLVLSWRDTANIPTGEALNSGTPVVSFHLDGSTEIYGDSIVQVPQGDIPAAVNATCDLLDNPSRADEMLSIWKDRREKYTEQGMGSMLLRALSEVTYG